MVLFLVLTLENHGYDFVINVIPVRVRDFTWQLSLNTSVTRNSVEKNNRVNGLEDYYTGSCVVNGRPFSTFYSYEFDGLEQEHGQPQFKHMNIEGAESPKDYLVESGKFTPDFSGGLNTMFKYKPTLALCIIYRSMGEGMGVCRIFIQVI